MKKWICLNVIVPHFDIPTPVEIAYRSKPAATPLATCLPGHVPYKYDKDVPYKYNATILEDGKEVSIKPLLTVENIVEASWVTRSGRVFALVSQKVTDVGKQPVETSVKPKKVEGHNNGVTLEKDVDDLLKIIELCDYKIIDQLLKTPSKSSILAMLMNLTAHQESLMRVLDQAS